MNKTLEGKPGVTTPTKPDTSWIPVRSGAFYCSPRCGGWKNGVCTWVKYQLAQRRAKALCKQLGPNWEPDVWENMGWHFRAVCGYLEVYAHHPNVGPPYYSCHLQTSPQFVTNDSYGDPAEAVRDVLNQAQALFRQMRSLEATINATVAALPSAKERAA